MDQLNELARTDIDPSLLAQVRALFAQQQARLAEKDFKITALTHELAYYRRIRVGKASETLVGEQSLLFEETADMDLAAIEEELDAQARVKRQRTISDASSSMCMPAAVARSLRRRCVVSRKQNAVPSLANMYA